MKKTALFISILLLFTLVQSQEKLSITINWPTKPDSLIYFGIHSNKTFLLDSAQLDSKGTGYINLPNDLEEGMYFIGFPRRAGFFDFIYEKGKSLTINVSNTNKPAFPNSSINGDLMKFYELNKSIVDLSKKSKKENLTNEENTELAKEYQSIITEKINFIDKYIIDNPNNYLTLMFKLQSNPDLSDLPLNTKEDSINVIQSQINRYWEGIDFNDSRIVNNPVFTKKLDQYFDQVIPLEIDTHKLRAEELIEKANKNVDNQRFLISYTLNKYINPKYIGFDEVLLHIYLKYIINQDNKWLGESNLSNVESKVNKIFFNQLNKAATDFQLIDIGGKAFNAFSSSTETGLIIAFWDPTCSHCKKDIPKLNQMVREEFLSKKVNIKILGVMVDGGLDNWKEFINTNKLSKDLWVHGYDSKEMRESDYQSSKPNFRQLYGIDQTPSYYYLDKEKNILIKGPISIEILVEAVKKNLKL